MMSHWVMSMPIGSSLRAGEPALWVNLILIKHEDQEFGSLEPTEKLIVCGELLIIPDHKAAARIVGGKV